MQTRRQSAVEAAANIALGYGVALFSQLLIFPWYGIQIEFSDNLMIGAWFTVISLVRSYGLRRFYNWRHR
jgi:hypothetical protein